MPNFSQVLLDHFKKDPDRVCVYLVSGNEPDQSITYQDLVDHSRHFVEVYKKAGFQPGDVVVLILTHGVDLIYAYFGAILHGCVPSIMPFLTEKLLPERYRADLEALIAITQPAGIVTYQDFQAEVQSVRKPGDSVKNVIVVEEISWQNIDNSRDFIGLDRKPEDIVLLQHSSGSTGLQKGVALSHQAVFNQLDVYYKSLHIDEDRDVIVSWLPLYHDMGLIACFLLPILYKIPLVLLSPFDWVKAPYRLMQAVTKYKGTLSWLPNFAFNFCAQKVRDRSLEGVDLASWRAVINCSEPMRWESHQAFYERFNQFGLRFEALATCYAMAENVFAVTQGGINKPVIIDQVDLLTLQSEKLATPAVGDVPSVKMLSAGKPLSNVRVKIMSDKGVTLHERQVGEIAILSDCMLTGYYHRPDLTQKAFIDGWYLTGDYGYLADGEVYITGRKKDLIIVGGKNIYPNDIEQLAMEVPEVHSGRVVAFGVFNEETGTEEVVLLAEVDHFSEQENYRISDGIREVVTRGSAIALREVRLVERKWLIKTSSGKIARSANKDKYLKEILPR